MFIRLHSKTYFCNIILVTAETTQQAVFTGVQTERPTLVRQNTFTKLEGEFTTETTSSVDFQQYNVVERTAKVKPRENKIVLGEETYQVCFLIFSVPNRRPEINFSPLFRSPLSTAMIIQNDGL